MNKIINKDCLEALKEIPDNSIDSIVTDPPYGLSFMGKKWDYDVPNTEIWSECLRVLKPGGYLLAFAGTRTQHRMAVRIEDAGFEIKDLIFWCYGQGFPKSQRIGCNCDRGMLQYTNETLSLSNNKEVLDLQAGFPLSEQVSSSEEQDLLKEVRGTFNIVEEKGGEEKTTSDLQTLQDRVLSEMDSKSQNNLLFTEVQRDSEVGTSKEVFSERIGNKESEEGIENGEEPSMERGSDLLEKKGELQTNKVCEMSEGISGNGEEGQLYNGTSFSNGDAHEKIINQNGSSASYQSRPSRQSDRESDVIPEQYTSQDIRRLCETCGGVIGAEGFGSALKPSLEPITMAKKPISEKNMRLNFLKWGVGGINIDGSRVGTEDILTRDCLGWASSEHEGYQRPSYENATKQVFGSTTGRFPANLIHDGSEEVLELFPETDRVDKRTSCKSSTGMFFEEQKILSRPQDNGGSAARFFKTCEFNEEETAQRFLYCPKASKSERNMGLDGFEEKGTPKMDGGEFINPMTGISSKATMRQNFHPTVKPIKLMEYLVNLVSKEGHTVLDPFAGSGTTGIACKKLNRNFIGIERDEEYCKIAEARIKSV